MLARNIVNRWHLDRISKPEPILLLFLNKGLKRIVVMDAMLIRIYNSIAMVVCTTYVSVGYTLFNLWLWAPFLINSAKFGSRIGQCPVVF